MDRRLHIINGDSTLQSLPLEHIGGEACSWFDFLSDGPPPDGTEAAWQRRSAELARRFGLDADAHLASAHELQARLNQADGFDETVLWFEGDLFCGFNLAFLLDWFAAQPVPQLSLVCPQDERLGALQPARLAELFDARVTVTPDMLAAGVRAWRALASGSEQAIAQAHAAAVPALARALRLQLLRFPDPGGGISEVERHVLSLLAAEPTRLGRLFTAFNESELGFQLGWGDHQFVVLLVDMQRRGLVAIDPLPGAPPYADFGAWLVSAAQRPPRFGAAGVQP